MAKVLVDWFSRLGQIGGDSRQELIHAAQRHQWDVEAFDRFVTGDIHNCRQLREVLRPKEVAAVMRAWRQDFPAKNVIGRQPVLAATPGPRAVAPQERVGAKATFLDRLDASDDYAIEHDEIQQDPYQPVANGIRHALAHEEQDDVGKASHAHRGRRHFESAQPTYERLQGEHPEIGVVQQRRHFGGAEVSESREVERFGGRRHFDEGSELEFSAAPLPPSLEAVDRFADPPDFAQRRHFAPPSSDRGLARFAVPEPRAGAGLPEEASYRPQRRQRSAPREAWPQYSDRQPSETSSARLGNRRYPPGSPASPVVPGIGDDSFQNDLDERFIFSGAFSVAVSPDGNSVYVAGASGLARFDAGSMQLQAHCLCADGRAAPAGRSSGYADVAAGASGVICADLDGTLFVHDPMSCALLAERPYEPSVFETTQRLLSGKLQRSTTGIIGLEGGFSTSPRIAVGESAFFIGGKDGVVTVLSPQTLTVLARTQLSEGPQALGIRMVHMASSQQRLYASVLSVLHVLTPGLQPLAKLRGGPRVPIFGNICSAVESSDSRFVFAADTGGPSVHMWETETWKWLTRVELVSGGGAARHLAVSLDNRLLYVSTEWGRFLAYDVTRLPLRCVEEGGGGGALAISKAYPEHVFVLTHGQLLLRGAERWLQGQL